MPYIMKRGHLYGEGNGTISAGSETADNAVKTLCDGDGNSIETTYETNDEFESIDIDLLEIQNNAAFHNSIFMGRNITDKFQDGTLYEKIANGTFEDIFVGDYFKATYSGTEKTFRIAGFNVYYNDGDSGILTAPHAVVVPDEALQDASMNGSNTTAGGYAGSAMYSTLSTVSTNLEAIFGTHLASKRELLTKTVDTNAVSAGWPNQKGTASDWAWYSVKACLMTETEVYGTVVFGSSGYDVASGYTQLPLFSLAPEFINPGRFYWWLRSVVSSALFALVANGGIADRGDASYSLGVRPRLILI